MVERSSILILVLCYSVSFVNIGLACTDVRSCLPVNGDGKSLKESGYGVTCPEEPRCVCQTTSFITKPVTIANCKNAGLTYIPKLPNNTYILDLSLNNIKDLGEKQFASYSSLLILNLTQNGLKELKPRAFEGLENLKLLSLLGNKLRYNSIGFKPHCFKPLFSLTTLNILQTFSRNDFRNESYQLEALSDLPQLETLFIDGIFERNLSDALQYLPSLKQLNFSMGWNGSRCSLPILNADFFPSNTKISYVSLSFCNINTIEKGTFQKLKKMIYLDLSHNEELEFKSMPNISAGLDSTNISVLVLNKIHETFGSCVEITVDTIKGLSNLTLKEVYLESNRISLLEKEAVQYIPESLEIVSLRDNIMMLGSYIFEIIRNYTKFNNLKKAIISDQDSNHFLSYVGERNVRDIKLSQSANVKRNDKRISINSSTVNFELKTTVMKTIDQHETNITLGKLMRVIKGHDQMSENGYKDYKDGIDIKVTELINGWMNGVPIPLPKNLETVDAGNMKIRLILNERTFKSPNSLRTLKLNQNIYWKWFGPFKGLENLTELDLSWNSCNAINPYIFANMPNLKILNLSMNYLDTSLNKDGKGEIFRYQADLEILDMSQNQIRDLPTNIFSGLKKLKRLDLSRNLLKKFKVDLSDMRQLTNVIIYDNQLETISKSARDMFDRQALANNLSLNILGNNFKCDCPNTEFVKWLAESPVRFVHKNEYRCRFSDSQEGDLSDAKTIYLKLQKECYNYIPIIISSTATLALVMSLTATALIYRYRWNLRYMYYTAKYKAKGYEVVGSSEDQFKQVNVSYADEDSGFVRQKIHRELEVNRGLTLHIRDRDSPIAAVSENIVEAIEKSHRTLIIMSKAYLKHKWCIFEMNLASIKALKTDEKLLCILMLEDVPHKDLPLKIMKIIKDQEHLEYPGEENLEGCFWDRLKSGLTD